MRVAFTKLNNSAVCPRTMTEGSCGYDLFANVTGPVVLAPGKRVSISTGISLQMPPNLEAQVRSRSGLALRYGVVVLNSPGTIDSDYRGEIRVILANFGEDEMIITNGDRIAQLVFNEITRAVLSEVEILDASERSAGGFGSTG